MESSATRVLDTVLERPEAQARQHPTAVLEQIPNPFSRRWFRLAIRTPLR